MSNAGPDQGRGIFPLRPLGVSEVLDAAVTTIRTYPRVTLGPSTLLYGAGLVVILAFGGIIAALIYGSDSAVAQEVAAGLAVVGLLGAESIGGMLQLAALAVFSTLMAGVVIRALLGRPAPLRAVWRDTKRSFGWLILYGLMLDLALVVPYLLLIPVSLLVAVPIVGPYLFVVGLVLLGVLTVFGYAQVWLAPPAIVTERVHVMNGIARSWRLTAGGRWRAAGLVALTLLICLLLWAAITSGVFSLMGIVANVLSIGFSTAVLSGIVTVATFVGGLLVGAATTPFLSVVASVAYVDRRSRVEGLDLVLGEARTAGWFRGPPDQATPMGPGTPFAGPADTRPPEPPRRPRPPMGQAPPVPAQHAPVGGPP